MSKKGIFEGGGSAGFEYVKGTRAGEELKQEVGTGELHNSNLFDQDETSTGETRDLATGKKIDNSTFEAQEDLNVVEGDAESVDQSNKNVWENPDDSAEEWLIANDPSHPKYKGSKDKDSKVS